MKSLLLRSHKYGFELLDNLLELCHSLAIGREAANSFSTLLYEDELLLNKLSHAKVSILFMQRIFNYCCDKLLKNLQHTNLEINYSLALSNILENIPNQIIVIDIHKLMLPIIRALSLGDEPLILSMLKIAQDIIPTSQSVINKHLGCFIDALLKLTVFNSIKVRVVALNNLKLLSVDGDYDCLMKYKDVVIKSLAPALDDKKRIVRKNAVDCREQWYIIIYLCYTKY
ncbi:RNAPII transcription regulator C-terminal-domain-containing protein [Pilobolus umbonatus]|nr:RNAPII transcription regulator C-terminal-domain-containing protein [Pilobolus umbonatus]